MWSSSVVCSYHGPVGRGYEQLESKNEYEQRSERKIAYGPRAKLRMVREQKRAGAESKIAYELRAVVHIGFRHYAICFFSFKKMASRCIASVIRL